MMTPEERAKMNADFAARDALAATPAAKAAAAAKKQANINRADRVSATANAKKKLQKKPAAPMPMKGAPMTPPAPAPTGGFGGIAGAKDALKNGKKRIDDAEKTQTSGPGM